MGLSQAEELDVEEVRCCGSGAFMVLSKACDSTLALQGLSFSASFGVSFDQNAVKLQNSIDGSTRQAG
jgi:hypothetical protein